MSLGTNALRAILAMSLAACGSGATSEGSTSDAAADAKSDSAAVPSDAADTGATDASGARFLGTYEGSYTSRNTYTEPAGYPPSETADVQTLTVRDGGSSDFTFTFDSDPPCVFRATLAGDRMKFAAGQSCTAKRLGFDQKTTVSTGDGALSGSTLTIDFVGTFTGTSPVGTSYAGSYVSAWAGQRR